MPILLILFIGVPIIEIMLFIEIGDWIGLWPTVGTILATALIGTALVRAQGLAVLADLRRDMDSGKPPVKAMLTGICLLLAGALLLTPGFLTDAIGFVLLIPPVRSAIGLFLATKIVARGNFQMHGAGFGAGSRPGPGRGPIIDGDYETVVDPDDDKAKPAQKDALPDASTPTERQQ